MSAVFVNDMSMDEFEKMAKWASYGLNDPYYKKYIEKAVEVEGNWKYIPNPPEWIPISERLPEDDRHVLCLTRTKKGLCNVVIGFYFEDMWHCGMNSNVTHWMELPEPPEVIE